MIFFVLIFASLHLLLSCANGNIAPYVRFDILNAGCELFAVRGQVYQGRWKNSLNQTQKAPHFIVGFNQTLVIQLDNEFYHTGFIKGELSAFDMKNRLLAHLNFRTSSLGPNDLKIKAASNVRYRVDTKLPRYNEPLGYVSLSLEKLTFFHRDLLIEKSIIHPPIEWRSLNPRV